MSIVSRDPFARTELHREAVHRRFAGTHTTCEWCNGHNAYGGLFEYWTVRDSDPHPKIPKNAKLFCSVGCMRSYYGE